MMSRRTLRSNRQVICPTGRVPGLLWRVSTKNKSLRKTPDRVQRLRIPSSDLPGQSYGRRLDRVVWRFHHSVFRSHWTRMITRTLARLILVLGLAGPATAAELDDAVTAAHSGDYATALRRLNPLAEKGDARAQFDIGFMHAYGWGFQRNSAEAITWYRKAADQGLEVAQHFLGLAYVNGEGVRPDDAEAARWF